MTWPLTQRRTQAFHNIPTSTAEYDKPPQHTNKPPQHTNKHCRVPIKHSHQSLIDTREIPKMRASIVIDGREGSAGWDEGADPLEICETIQ